MVAATAGRPARLTIQWNTGPVVAGTARERIPAALEQWRQAYEVRSLESLEPLYAHTDDLMVVWQGRSVQSWPSVRAYLGAFLAANTRVKLVVRDVRLAAIGSDAVSLTATVERRYGDGVRSVSENGILTMLFRLAPPDDEGKPATWRIASEHFSFASVPE
jgi:hypothetical protein